MKRQRQSLRFHRKGLPTALFVTLLSVAFLILFRALQGSFGDLRSGILVSIALGFSALTIFMILYTGKIHRWRRIYFTTYAVAFAISFVWTTMGDRGHMWLLDEEILYARTPMCHFVAPMLILPIALGKGIIFPAGFGEAVFMLVLVLVVGLVYGRAFCSWGCFYGGQDELFSSLRKKASWRIKKLHPFIRYLPFGLLAFILLTSLATLSPTYCFWFCPFKATTEFIEVNSFIRVIQTFLFVGLWLGLVVVLPLLTKKRTQCATFCPIGALFSCTNKVNLFDVKVDRDKCIDCKLCISVCPTFSMTEDSLSKGKPTITCSKCGACIEACPEGAISYSTKGVLFTASNHPLREGESQPGFWRRLARDLWDPGVVFVFGIFVLTSILASEWLVDAMSRLLNLVGV